MGGAGLALENRSPCLRSLDFVLRRLLWREQWYLLAARQLPEEGAADRRWEVERLAKVLEHAHAIVPPKDRYWADPHLLPGGEGRYVLVEEFMHSTGRGRIVMLHLDPSGRVVEARPLLELESHLSYPAVFEFDGALYMVPESSALGRIDAYKCTTYPWQWEFESTLLEGVRACDSSIVEFKGRWWLFATVIEQPWLIPRDNLHVFFAEDPLRGPWRPHAGNPVLCDVNGSRPAGRPFVLNGSLYRLGQDCSLGYGYGIRIKEVTSLTENSYDEREVAYLDPAGAYLATHTLAVDERMAFVDVMRRLPRVPRLSVWRDAAAS